MNPRRPSRFAAALALGIALAALIVLVAGSWPGLPHRAAETAAAPPSRHAPAGQGASPPPAQNGVPLQTLVFDLPAGWKEIPGQLSRTFRSSREGAGLFQISMHPPLDGTVDGPRAEKELDGLLREMKSEMAFGPRVEIGNLPAAAGSLACAKYQSPHDGTLGFWLLAGKSVAFATYVDGGTPAAEADLREAQAALQSAHFE